MIDACQWNKSSPTGPAEHCEGGSLPMSWSSLLILFIDILLCFVCWNVCASGCPEYVERSMV